MIVWINGAFGAGKSTTAQLVQGAAPRSRLWDPEEVGAMLRTVVSDLIVQDFQDWPAWREVVIATGQSLVKQTGQHLVAPQTVVRQDYWREISDGFASRAIPLFHVVLDAPTDVLRERIMGDSDKPESVWRLERLSDYNAARTWLTGAADLVIETVDLSPHEVAAQIVTAAGLT